jgi:hypothetical protein
VVVVFQFFEVRPSRMWGIDLALNVFAALPNNAAQRAGAAGIQTT